MYFQYWFHRVIIALIVFLPWSVFISVFLTHGLGVPGASFIKELLLILAGILLLLCKYQDFRRTGKNPFTFSWIDLLIVGYIIWMIVITACTTGVAGLLYGGKYDLSFLIAFLIAMHGYSYLRNPLSYYLRIFLLSGGVMLFVSGLLKFPLQEELLVYFGYSPAVSAWQFGSAPPIYHGIDGANVRRFQGLLDGPNSMGAFLIMYIGILIYFMRYKREWYFLVGSVVFILIVMLLYTYSRSAMLAFGAASVMSVFVSLRFLYGRYKVQVVGLIGIILMLGSVVFIKYSGASQTIIGREGSTRGHIERMGVGVDRFLSAPLGQGMGSAGPAYRHVYKLHNVDRKDIEERDGYYIPESWYIQQYIEGGIIGGTLFLLILFGLFLRLLYIHPALGALFFGIGIMNFFLHTFESSAIALTLFILIGLLLGNDTKRG